ncbi:MAG: hypothetical protein K2Q20_11025, partial [Phycisphaerales bacterium]|nr:hypothetical protein [Phycisphaerales bacterium]
YQPQVDIRSPISTGRAAAAADFGANTGLQEVSRALDQTATALNRAAEMEDSSAASRMVAETRAKWAIKLNEDMKFAESQLFAPNVQPAPQGQIIGGGGEPDVQVPGMEAKRTQKQAISYKDFATKYVTDLNDEILKMRGAMQTRQGVTVFDNMMSNLRADFTTRAFEAQADLAGRKAVADFNGTVNANTNTLMADPTHFTEILRETADTFKNMTSIPAGMRDKLWQETQGRLAMAAGRGFIDANPMLAMKSFRDGVYDDFLTPEQKKQLIGESITEMKAVEVMAEKLRKQAKEQQALEREATNNDFLDKYQQGKLSWNDVKGSNLEAMGEGSKNFWLGMLDRQAREGTTPVKTDAALYWDLTRRINLPAGDPRKIVDQNQLLAYHDRISISDLKELRTQTVQMRGEDGSKLGNDTNRFLESMRSQFIKAPIGVPDPQGEEAFYKFNFALRQEMEKYRDENKDPRDLLNPNSPAYFGKQMKLYTPSQQERIQSMVDSAKEEFGKGPQGVDASKLPSAPTDPLQRAIGQSYNSPTGVVTWTDDGWRRGVWKKIGGTWEMQK